MNKKILFASLFIVLMVGLVTAAWFFEHDKKVDGEIVATGKKLDLVVDLNNFSINTSTGILNNTQDLIIDNKKDPRLVTFTIAVNKTLIEPMCPEYENDCSVEFWNETNPIPNGTSYTIPKGLLRYKLNTTCVPFSCGQNISVRVLMNEP